MGGIIFLGAVVVLGGALGWVAFFMLLSTRADLRALERRIGLQERAPSSAPVAAPSPTMMRDNSIPSGDAPPAPAGPIEREVRAAQSALDEAKAKPADGDSSAPSWRAEQEEGSGRNLESTLAGNWLVWLGGAALVLGGAFLVKSAIDAGFFGPGLRILSALLAGAAMITASQWLKNQQELLDPSLAAPVLAGAGGATIYGAIFAAYGLYHMVPPVVAFILFVAASAGLVVLAVIHRAPAMAGLALVGAHLSPIITSDDSANATILLVYVFGVSLAGLATARVMGWRIISYLALAGGLLWPALLIIDGVSASDAPPLAVYLPAFVIMAALVAWDHADRAVVAEGQIGEIPVALTAFYVAAAGALFLAFAFTAVYELNVLTVAMWGEFALAALFLAWRREGFALTPAMSAAAIAAVFGLVRSAPDFPVLWTGAAFALLYGAAGFELLRQRAMAAPLAIASAFGPVAILAALFYAVGSMQQALGWGAAALVIVFYHLAALASLANRPGGFDSSPGAASSYALAASLAAVLAVAMSAEGLTMSVGFALQAPVIAWLWRRFGLSALRLSAIGLGALASARLLFFPETLTSDVGETPLLNWLIPAYLLPAAGFWLSARWFEGGGASRSHIVVQTMEGAAIALFAAFLSLEIRHMLNGGDLNASYMELLEISLQTMTWAGVAAFMRWRFGAELTFVRSWAEKALLALAAAQTVIGPMLFLNPWWGDDAAAIGGPPVLNMLVLYYLGPAAAFAAAAYFCHRAASRLLARMAALFAALLSYVWLLLVVRHAFHAPDLSLGVIGDGESWAYSLAAIVYATAVLVVGATRRSVVFRYAGFGAVLLAVGKVFLFDMAGLTGVLRATSFLGLGAALVGVAALYQRMMSRKDEEEGDA